MEDYKRGSDTVWGCKYDLVWVTKYRHDVLGGSVGQRRRALLQEIAMAHEMQIDAGAINRDHVHMLISPPPHLSVSRAVQHLKGKSSHKMLREFKSLRKRHWGQHLWARGCWVASGGTVTDEVWKGYIKGQKPPEPDDDFKVVWCAEWRTDPVFSRNRKPPALASGEFTTRAHYAVAIRTAADLGDQQQGFTEEEMAVLCAVAYHQPIDRAGLVDIFGKEINRDLLGRLHYKNLIGNDPKSPRPSAPHTFVTMAEFLAMFDLQSLRDLPELDLEAGEADEEARILRV